MSFKTKSPSSLSLPLRWFSKSTLVFTLIFLALTLPSTTARRRHRHKHGGKIPISNNLYNTYASSWKSWEQSNRYKRQDFMTDPSSDESESGPWSQWTKITTCTRTCGGGVVQESRYCNRDGQCSGRDIKYSSCNIQECPEGTVDFRAEQCTKYDSAPFEGHYYTWIPYTKSPRKCELNCQPRGERYYYRHSDKVLDGTRCEEGADNRDVCVNGECVPVGCDFLIGSGTQEDKCRVCGGDGSTCTTISGLVDIETMIQGYNDIVLIPKGATNILLEEVQSSNNYLAIRNATGHYYLNGNWKIDFPTAMDCVGTTVHYERRADGNSLFAPEIVRSLGPTNETLYLVLLYQETNTGVLYEFTVPKIMKDIENIVYNWRMNGWSDCSVSCGGGHMTRDVSCVKSSDDQAVDENLELCDPRLTPSSNETCNNQPCQSSWQTGDWTRCSSECGTVGIQYRHTFCGQKVSEGILGIIDDSSCEENDSPKPEKMRKCNTDSDCPTYHIAEWSHCDKLCGTGKQTRIVTCHRVTNTTTVIYEDSECSQDKPETEQTCEAVPCEGVDWIASEWSKCKSPCGASLQSRKVFCVTREGTVVVDALCDVDRKPSLTQECDKPLECSHRWYASEWSECSEHCGQGIQTRHVFCGSFEGSEIVSIVADDLCNEENKLSSSEVCTGEGVCENEWFTAPVGQCSTKCGGGYQRREVFCFNNDNPEKYTSCEGTSKPFEEDQCNSHACSPDEMIGITEDDDLPWCEDEVIISETDVDELMESELDDQDDEESVGSGDEMIDVVTQVSHTTESDGLTTDAKKLTTIPEDSSTITLKTGEPDEFTTLVTGADIISTSVTVKVDDLTTVIASLDNETTVTTSLDDESTVAASTVTTSLDDDEKTVTAERAELKVTTTTDASLLTVTGEADDSLTLATKLEDSSVLTSETLEAETGTVESDYSRITTTESVKSTTVETESDMTMTETDSVINAKESEPGSIDDYNYSDHDSENYWEHDSENSAPIEVESTTLLSETDNSTIFNDTFVSMTETTMLTIETTMLTTMPSTTEAEIIEDKLSRKKRELDLDSTLYEDEGSGLLDSAGSGFEEDVGSGDNNDDSITTTQSVTVLMTDEERKCKQRPKIDPDEPHFGYCMDGKKLAEGPFKEGCEIFSTCDETMYGCCPDDINKAEGKLYLGCPGFAICSGSLFGCCSDNFTEAKSPDDDDSCKNLIQFHCADSKFGCCQDNATKSKGKDFDGCPVVECEGSTGCECNESMFGCCPDGVTEAQGFDFEGCINETDEEGSGTETTRLSMVTDPLPDCSYTAFGCCEDNYTAAHGFNNKGCCLSSSFGCCPDHISIAIGPEYEGCGCEFSEFKCCPDNETLALGPNNAGCGCKYTEFGCCPDNHTPSLTANQTDCPCNTFKFGCCSDGTSIASGPDDEGCGCAFTEFKCCGDGRTAATGPNNDGCGCEASHFGCCTDGVTPAEGKLYEGCKEEPHIIPGEVCGFERDRGPCRNWTMKYYFDITYGGCTRFWYGGCDGNLNRFTTEQECENVCVKPEGLDACRLPSVSGPCSDSQIIWYHDSETLTCRQFEYRGCLGNQNRFATIEQCEQVCIIPEKTDSCLLDVKPGPCLGNYSRWHYDQTVDKCIPFTFGGCKGNSNNFLSENECMHRCIVGRSQDICSLPKASGNCEETIPRWFYDSHETRCMPFYYTGCAGNANKFSSIEKCESICKQDDAEPIINACSLPKSPGDCTDFVRRFYYDSLRGKCRDFHYGGCGGNSNNYHSMEDCEGVCENKITTPIFKTESCFLASERGTCGSFEALWSYDSTDGTCKQFLYSGCGGNANRFGTKAECKHKCEASQDVCDLPKTSGSCNGNQKQYYYNSDQKECVEFSYSGCEGNGNRFDSMAACQYLCQEEPIIKTIVPDYPDDEDLSSICKLPMYTGNCRSAFPNWYYDVSQRKCIAFTYGGCLGNANRFKSIEQCDRQCGIHRNQDVCRPRVDAGNCAETNYIKWFYDPLRRTCQQFRYSGCGGNGNRFSSQEECEYECVYIETIFPDLPGEWSDESNIAICELQSDAGPCTDGYKRWAFNTESSSCDQFLYGGCSGNRNRFTSYNKCQGFCQPAVDKYRSPVEKSTTEVYDPCSQEKLHCQNIECSYGTTRRVDSNNCDACDCFNPCENMICYEGSQCIVDLIQSRRERYETVRYVPHCIEENKPGSCPAISEASCDKECETDATCSGDLKCCFNGCSYACVPPVVEQITDKVFVPVPVTHEVGSPATITYADTKISVEENDVATLVCQSDGNPTPVLSWLKDGRQLDVSEDSRFQLSLDYSLLIMNVGRKDGGFYQCIANNGIGSPDQRDVELEVLDPSPRTVDIIPPRDTSPVVTLGSPIILRCWSSGWPRAQFSWWRFKNMMPTTSEKYQTLPLGGLRITSVTLRDLGPYTCQAYNGIGSAATITFVVRALGPVTAVSPRDKLFIQYIVTPPEIPTFTLETTKLTDTFKRPTYGPHPHPVTRSPIVTEVPLHHRPNIPVGAWIRTNLTKFILFSDIRLPCEVQGYPPPSIYWYHNNVLLPNNDRISIDADNTLRIEGADDSNTGTYMCEVRNQYGQDRDTITIKVQGIYVHPTCTDNPFFANCNLIVKAEFCTNTYYARFCCKSCTIAGLLPSIGPHLKEKSKRRRRK